MDNAKLLSHWLTELILGFLNGCYDFLPVNIIWLHFTCHFSHGKPKKPQIILIYRLECCTCVCSVVSYKGNVVLTALWYTLTQDASSKQYTAKSFSLGILQVLHPSQNQDSHLIIFPDSHLIPLNTWATVEVGCWFWNAPCFYEIF